ncbi:pullulanase X25 domain-containing protein [Arthrobacter sp. H41]|uniref:pullulanase X25 domain-containing protein n=1 Tax=Arthrobacter sp. H41 TaxID=1312978 RepID=UPI0012DC840F|nr:glycosidase [Arthrobacter sp. H41]
MAKVPFDATEAELLSSGVPRGYKQLTTATSKLVKAGWLVKARSGWTATEEGVRALAAFPDAEAFADAAVNGKPVPEPVAGQTAESAAEPALEPVPEPLPELAAGQVQEELPVQVPQAPEQVQEDQSPVSAHVFDSGDQDQNQAQDPDQPALVEEAVVASGEPHVAAPEENVVAPEEPATNDAWQDQPQSVALAGDFNPLFGEAGHWTTNLRGLQLDYDAVENVWKLPLQLPAGTYQYKIVVNGSWDENYGAFGVLDGANHELRLLSDTAVMFRFDYATKDIETS